MPQDPFPSPGCDGEEPDASVPSPAADAMPPGPLLAWVVHALTGDGGEGLAALSDDQLVGITPWHHDGLTCPCNLAPLCRHHHGCKQAEGWWLEQPEPGALIWRVPSGRAYVTGPTVYPL